MPTLIEMAVLLAVLYVFHKSFHKVTMVGFLATAAIAMSANYYLTAYLNVNFLIALAVTLVIFPVLQILFRASVMGKTGKALMKDPVVEKLNVMKPEDNPDQQRLNEAFPEFLDSEMMREVPFSPVGMMDEPE